MFGISPPVHTLNPESRHEFALYKIPNPENLLATLLVAGTTFYFSCKQFATFCKEMYEKLAHAPTVIQVAGDSSARDTSSPYKWDQRKNYKL